MNEENKIKRVIILSLAGLLIGTLLFIFGISISSSIIPLIANYFIAMILYICSFLAVYNNHKKQPQALFKYLSILIIFFILFITIALFINIS